MSIASSSSLRTLRTLHLSGSRSRYLPLKAQLSTYNPLETQDPNIHDLPPNPKPTSANFFSGKPTLNDKLSSLQQSLKEAQETLREDHIFPLPTLLPYIQPPQTSWQTLPNLSTTFETKLRTGQYKKIMKLLNELHHLRHVADLAGKFGVVENLGQALCEFERPDSRNSLTTTTGGSDRRGKGEVGNGIGIDELGRSFGLGRRKESSARVWIIPTKGSREFLDAPHPSAEPVLSSPETELSTSTEETSSITSPPTIPSSQILVNHLPLPLHFSKPSDREHIIRPLKITGLLGAFNVFALVRGGGTTGQAGAISMGLARALAEAREDVRVVLENDGALMRDTRMVERKKTGLVKARKRWTWVKR